MGTVESMITYRKILTVSGIFLFILPVVLLMDIPKPGDGHEWKGSFGSGSDARTVDLEAGSYEVWVDANDDPGIIQIMDVRGNQVPFQHSQEGSTSLVKNGKTFLRRGIMDISSPGIYTISTEEEGGTLYLVKHTPSWYPSLLVISLLCSLLLMLAGVFGKGIHFRRLKREHCSRMEDLAGELGLGHTPEDRYHISQEYGYLNLFRKTQGGRVFNVLHGSYKGEEVLLFNYEFKTNLRYLEGGVVTKVPFSTEGYLFSGLIIGLDREFPELTVRPQTLAARFSSPGSLEDIEFDNLTFSQRYTVNAQSRSFAYSVLHPRMIETFLAEGELFFELERDSIIIYWEMARVRNIYHRLDMLVAVKKLLPNYLFSTGSGETTPCPICASTVGYDPGKKAFFCQNCKHELNFERREKLYGVGMRDWNLGNERLD